MTNSVFTDFFVLFTCHLVCAHLHPKKNQIYNKQIKNQ